MVPCTNDPNPEESGPSHPRPADDCASASPKPTEAVPNPEEPDLAQTPALEEDLTRLEFAPGGLEPDGDSPHINAGDEAMKREGGRLQVRSKEDFYLVLQATSEDELDALVESSEGSIVEAKVRQLARIRLALLRKAERA